jgi:uncharacterized protein YbjQ (UPF0145 family)
MIIVNTDFIPGYRIVEVVGLSKGSSVRGASLGTDISAWFKNQVGGEIEEYTKMLAESREQALDRLLEHARTQGADAVINVRFITSHITDGAAELLVYGTAVKIEKE